MPKKNNMLYCPVNMASDVLQPRWTIQILFEMQWGSTRFNDIRRGVPGISPTLLAKRLKTLQAQGLIERIEDGVSRNIEYIRTKAAVELEPIIADLGKWAYRNRSVQNLTCRTEPKAFVWNLRNSIDTSTLPNRRVVMKLSFPEQESDQREFWIMHRPGFGVEVCFLDPGFDVDLFITSEFEALTSAYFGYESLARAIEEDRISLIGQVSLSRSIGQWLILSSYASLPAPDNK